MCTTHCVGQTTPYIGGRACSVFVDFLYCSIPNRVKGYDPKGICTRAQELKNASGIIIASNRVGA